MQRLKAIGSQETALKTNEDERAFKETVSSFATSQDDLSRSDGGGSGDKEKMRANNGSVIVEEDCENTTVEETPESEPSTDDGSGETEEWNCTIQ